MCRRYTFNGVCTRFYVQFLWFTSQTLTLEMTFTQVVETSISINNSPSQDYDNLDDQPTTNIDSGYDFHTGCRNVSLYLQQSFSGLRQPGRSTNHKHWLWIWLPHRLSKRQSQPTTVLLRTTTTWTINHTNLDDKLTTNIDSEDDFHTCRLLKLQSFSGLHQPWRSTNHKDQLIWIQTFHCLTFSSPELKGFKVLN